jgi:Uma2 family endonuclease
MAMLAPDTPPISLDRLPDHTQLPETDGTFVKNFQEHPQSVLLTVSIRPLLQRRRADGQFAIGQDSGIYWNLTAALSDQPVRGAVSPDWFYVEGVPPLLNGAFRRSYVMWQEIIAPLVVLEFVSGDGSEERDRTPITGKFWVYEQAIRPAFYGIYEVEKAAVEVYRLIENRYELLPANERGHFSITPLGVELGIWRGRYQNMEAPWLRWWDAAGKLLPNDEERAEQAEERAEQAEERAARLAMRLRELGIDPDGDNAAR